MHVDILIYMNTFKVNKGGKPTLNYYFLFSKSKKLLGPTDYHVTKKPKQNSKKRKEIFLTGLLEWRVDFPVTEDRVSTSDCLKTQSAEQCSSQ